jgi:hypothetical protein
MSQLVKVLKSKVKESMDIPFSNKTIVEFDDDQRSLLRNPNRKVSEVAKSNQALTIVPSAFAALEINATTVVVEPDTNSENVEESKTLQINNIVASIVDAAEKDDAEFNAVLIAGLISLSKIKDYSETLKESVRVAIDNIAEISEHAIAVSDIVVTVIDLLMPIIKVGKPEDIKALVDSMMESMLSTLSTTLGVAKNEPINILDILDCMKDNEIRTEIVPGKDLPTIKTYFGKNNALQVSFDFEGLAMNDKLPRFMIKDLGHTIDVIDVRYLPHYALTKESISDLAKSLKAGGKPEMISQHMLMNLYELNARKAV